MGGQNKMNGAKNWTAKELSDIGIGEITVAVYGYDFCVTIDEDYGTQTCMYIDRRDNHSNLLSFDTLEKTFRKVGQIREAITKDLDSIFKKISAFKKDYESAFSKHGGHIGSDKALFQKDKGAELFELKKFIEDNPQKIFEYTQETFAGDLAFIKKALRRNLQHKQPHPETKEYFAYFGMAFAKEAFEEFGGRDDFAKKAVFASQDAEGIIGLLAGDEA